MVFVLDEVLETLPLAHLVHCRDAEPDVDKTGSVQTPKFCPHLIEHEYPLQNLLLMHISSAWVE